MDFAHFMRIEREVRGKTRHYVVHTRDPKFSVELAPDTEAADKIGKGVIKRLCVPNSCVGDYTKCAQFVTAAQEFFRESFAEPVAKSETRRFQT
jgi:hypothetical protein